MLNEDNCGSRGAADSRTVQDQLSKLYRYTFVSLDVARRRGVRELAVFGSVARGEQRPTSDVDFLAAFEPGRSLLYQVHLIDELTRLLDVRVDVVAKGGLLDRDRHILEEAVRL